MSAWNEIKAGWKDAVEKDALLMPYVFGGAFIVMLGHCIAFGVTGFFGREHSILDRRFLGECFISTLSFFLGRLSILARGR